jgi:beta-glucosidase
MPFLGNRTKLARATKRARIPLAIVAAGALTASVLAAYATTTDVNPGPLELANAALSRTAATEGMVLLENHDAALPMAKSGNVAVFGVGAYKTVKGGTGSGNVNNRYTITVRQGLENAGYTVTTSSAYWGAMTSAYDTKYGNAGGGLFGPAVDYASVEQALTTATVQPSAPTSTAIFVVARNAGEGADRSDTPGDYQLTDTEKGDIALIGQTYQKVIVVLNTGGIMDTSFFTDINASVKDPSGGTAVDALLLMSQAGEESGNALAEVLNGTVNPSGHLTDTWASKYSYYPASATFGNNDGNTATESYSEGIYVGYRYFDSFYKTINPADPGSVVTYPFGYGLSYTTFKINIQNVQADDQTVAVRAKVTNTGSQSGKDVVQVYFSAPQTGLDKPYQELAAYGKTDLLAPGESQTLTLSYPVTQMASYDPAKSADVMDAGTYLVRVGDSSRSTHVAARLELRDSVTTDLFNHEMDGQPPSGDLHSSPANFYTYDNEGLEASTAPVQLLKPSDIKVRNDRSVYEQNVAVPSTSPYYALDGSPISSTTAYVAANQVSNWDGTGAPYQAKVGETVKTVNTVPGATLYDVAKGTVTMSQFVAGLNVDQMGNIVEGSSTVGSTPAAVGAAGYSTAKYENIGIPGMVMSDGPAGLRITQQINTTPPTYQWATAWPIGTMLAQTWNTDLLRQVGDAIGKEMREYGATLWLAPGMNIHRDPLNGRNFEYYSEDPLVGGLSAAATTQGVQSNAGVGVTLKHFVANNQEANRNNVNELISERALREIYLKGFQYAVESSQPMAVMASYNKENGTWSADNYDLLTDILRGEWGFKGTVMSDWGGSHGAVNSMYSGNDLIMPGGNPDDVINATKKIPAVIDITGLPAYNLTTLTFGTFSFTSYSWKTGSFTLSASGGETITTTVDQNTDLSQTPLSGSTASDGTFTPNAKYASVDAAYHAVATLLAGNALNPAQKAAISISNVAHATAGDNASPVTAYTVTVKGAYTVNMRLGDLQRSVMRVLNTAMQSEPFEQLAAKQGVTGIHVGSYTGQFGDLAQFVTVEKSKVTGP